MSEESEEFIVDEDLQNKFLELVDEMIEAKCPMPDFKLYYMTMKLHDKYGPIVKIKPFFTHEEARQACGDDEDGSEWRHASRIQYNVIDSTNKVKTYNYGTGQNDDNQIDINMDTDTMWGKP